MIDFGVAKALDHRLTEKTLFTETGQLIGTLEYMSPGAGGRASAPTLTRAPMSTRWAWCLYELLTGTVPFDAVRLRTAGFNEMQRIIREVVPPRPSTRFSSLGESATQVASQRRITLEHLERQLHRELDWIPLKAMRKTPSERYATANELADDIQNYLASRPLRAGPESASYRLRKFLRRNQRGVAASVVVTLVLIAGVVTTAWQAIRATRAEARTLPTSENLLQVNRFLTEDLLASASPSVTRGREMSVREAVDRAAETVGARFHSQPLTEAAVRAALAETYESLGQTETGLHHAQTALEIHTRESGIDSEQSLAPFNASDIH